MSQAPIPIAPGEYSRADMQRIMNSIEQRLSDMERPKSKGWAVTNNAAPVKTLDVTAATLAELRVVVGTLIQVMQRAGILTI